jgi:chromosome segregation ATPase
MSNKKDLYISNCPEHLHQLLEEGDENKSDQVIEAVRRYMDADGRTGTERVKLELEKKNQELESKLSERDSLNNEIETLQDEIQHLEQQLETAESLEERQENAIQEIAEDALDGMRVHAENTRIQRAATEISMPEQVLVSRVKQRITEIEDEQETNNTTHTNTGSTATDASGLDDIGDWS